MPTHVPGWKLVRSEGSWPDWFQIRVLPLLRRMAACVEAVSKQVVDGTDTLRGHHCVDIIEKNIQGVSWLETALDSGQRRVLAKRKQCGHEWDALFSTLCLCDDLRLAVPIMPDVFRGLGVPQPDEREATVDPLGVEQAL